MVNPGQNYLYLYQRDVGYTLAGIIFSATIEVVPAPGAASLGLAGLLLMSKRRR